MQEEEVRRRFEVVTWRLDSKLAKGGGAQNGFQHCLNPSSSNEFLFLRANSRTFRRQCYWSWIARQDTESERTHRASPPRRERMNSRRKEPEKRKTSGKQHDGEPDGRREWHGETSCDLTQSRIVCSIKILGNAFKIRYIRATWRSLKRKACHFDQTRSYAFVLYSSLHWESGMYENSGWALPEGSLNSESAASRVKNRTHNMVHKIRKPRIKIILGTIERFEELRRHL